MNRLGIIFETMIKAAPVRLWAMIASGPVQMAFAGWLVMIIWQGVWPVDRAQQRLWFLGTALLTTLAVNAVIIIALAAARVKGQGPAGVSFEVESGGGSDPAPASPAKVTVTATAESKP